MTPDVKAQPVLEAQDLRLAFRNGHRHVEALRSVSLELYPGEVFAVVGESGSGKSTLARALLGMHRIQSGTIKLCGQPLAASAGDRTLAQRRGFGMVFQDSSAAFDPRFTIRRILQEALKLLAPGQDGLSAPQLLDLVGLPALLLERHPHELSGGQRQRIGIARALAGQPGILICDEAVSALDVSVQAQILNLLGDLQAEKKLALLFITHDLSVVSYIADRIAVMYHGSIIETGNAAQILDNPAHDYTRKLLSAAY